MPVTQTRIDLKPTPDAVIKSTKPTKPVLKLHAPGFHSPAPSPVDAPVKQERVEPRENTSQFPIRSHHVDCRSQYSHTDAYSAFFAGSAAAHGTARVPRLNNTYLRPNAKFLGTQQSGCSSYDIKVEIKTVDLVSSVVTGFFQISGLTDEHPLITTCFKGEIINNPLHRMQWGEAPVEPKRYSFVTEENNWSSFPKNDLEHWKKLTGCPSIYSEEDMREKLRLIQSGQQDSSYIYMRWKEEFLLPDSRVKSLTGASFEGFYYVVLNIGGGPNQPNEERLTSDIPPGTMSGLYFYTQSEKFQSLSLRYVDDRGQSSTFDFA
ncbi:hypothetical protein JCM33374_g6426 [Metschnikowia sp. JCM 33374]|nr:hypothetical protein JCM33374_g6426 [Metschnikowia sp. JCM 33374]